MTRERLATRGRLARACPRSSGDFQTENLLAGQLRQRPVVREVGNAIHWINHYLEDNAIVFPNIHPLDSAIQHLNIRSKEYTHISRAQAFEH